ncbi:MAG: hypothetical protein OXC12_18000 [Spirochaetaceae bacterium]|nr:hypothetical protein [Spirochaetaceae bacterium]
MASPIIPPELPPSGLLSLSSITTAMLVAAIRLRPFQHKRKINELANKKLNELNGDDHALEVYKELELVHQLNYLSGYPILGKTKIRLHWPLRIASFLKIACYCLAGLSIIVLFVSSLYEFEFVEWSFKLRIISFAALWVGLVVALSVGMLGESLVKRSRVEIDRIARELETTMRIKKKPDLPPSREPPDNPTT